MFTNLLTILTLYFGMCDATNLSEFFKTKNLALITWEHAVNNKIKLENTLKTDIQMLEADVQLGNLTDSTSTMTAPIPIMAHPPATTSDLSLEQFLKNVTGFNSKHPSNQKGIKLDFKSIEAFNSSIPILRSLSIDQVPVWLNADIIKGPGNPQSTPVDAAKFLTQAKLFPNATLSVGWTTNHDNTTTNVTYTPEDVALMLDTLKANGVNQSVSFPVRGVYAAESSQQLRELIANYSGATLTVWSAESDPVNVKNLRKMILDIGMDKIYVDVPKKLMDELNLNGAAPQRTLGMFSIVFGVLVYVLNMF